MQRQSLVQATEGFFQPFSGVWFHFRSVGPAMGYRRMQKTSAPLVGAQGYQMFPLSKPVVGRDIALHAVPVTWLLNPSTCLVFAFPAHSTSFTLNFFNPQRWNVYGIVNQNEYILFRPDVTLRGSLGVKHQGCIYPSLNAFSCVLLLV